MFASKWVVGMPVSDDAPSGYIDEQILSLGVSVGYTIHKNNKIIIWQWHIFDEPGFVLMSDDPKSTNYWEKIAAKHISTILAEESIAPVAPPEPAP